MIKESLLIILVLFVFETYSQHTKRTLLNSTISTVGSNSVQSISKNKIRYQIAQSIGQSSIIGTKSTSKINVQQGFLNNSKIFNINNSNIDIIDESLRLVISPNPFIEFITLNFSKETKHKIHIRIYDINRKIIFTKEYTPTDNLLIPLKHYSIGTYIIRIQSGTSTFTEKLLKTE
ncbi:T9SS type A sorting domain-containing protein [Polaribacter sp. Q13]|uniref:T9SS type A sorting domain-containing protein n=1 Tax=Polaribacter sp. Q13 TaxID=2806551 RepID=UPI00193C1017|nr:T9SS type A sorting domain-containing protein [Polaribacter sp. Q13]QVY66726.1 T9SS type A sorting domain-containing protein [Polaribacter sp. Q13]